MSFVPLLQTTNTCIINRSAIVANVLAALVVLGANIQVFNLCFLFFYFCSSKEASFNSISRFGSPLRSEPSTNQKRHNIYRKPRYQIKSKQQKRFFLCVVCSLVTLSTPTSFWILHLIDTVITVIKCQFYHFLVFAVNQVGENL